MTDTDDRWDLVTDLRGEVEQLTRSRMGREGIGGLITAAIFVATTAVVRHRRPL